MSIERVIDLTVKKLSSSISKKETDELESLISDNGELRKVFEETVETWKQSGAFVPKIHSDAEASWSRFKEKIQAKSEPKVFTFSPFYKVAAAIIIAVGLGISFFNPWNTEHYVTQAGEILEIELADHSVITLNELSSLTVSKAFNKEERLVDFEGEAYFNIAENPQKPFIIQSNSSEIRVLGTSFNVDARKERTSVEVDVTSGRVSLSEIGNPSNRILLTMGMKGTFNSESKELVSVEFENQNFQAWRTEVLVFDDLKMSTVLDDMEEYFGVDLSVENEAILNCTFTSSFTSPTLEEVVEILSLTLDLDYTETGNKYTFTGVGCVETQDQ